MSFTATEKVSIATITGVSTIQLDTVLAAYADHISAEAETAVRAEIARWETSGGKFTSIEPTESNKGVRVNASLAKEDIRKNIANLLFLTDYVGTSSAQGVLVRA